MTEDSEQDAFVEDVWRTYLTTGGITEKNENKVDSIDFAGFYLEYFCGFAALRELFSADSRVNTNRNSAIDDCSKCCQEPRDVKAVMHPSRVLVAMSPGYYIENVPRA